MTGWTSNASATGAPANSLLSAQAGLMPVRFWDGRFRIRPLARNNPDATKQPLEGAASAAP
jgi:hypothetical protein